jgi:hypothetical protein
LTDNSWLHAGFFFDFAQCGGFECFRMVRLALRQGPIVVAGTVDDENLRAVGALSDHGAARSDDVSQSDQLTLDAVAVVLEAALLKGAWASWLDPGQVDAQGTTNPTGATNNPAARFAWLAVPMLAAPA